MKTAFASVTLTRDDLEMLRAIRLHHGNQNFIHNIGFYPLLDRLCKDCERHFGSALKADRSDIDSGNDESAFDDYRSIAEDNGA